VSAPVREGGAPAGRAGRAPVLEGRRADGLVVWCPLGVEAAAVRRGLRGGKVVRVGWGPALRRSLAGGRPPEWSGAGPLAPAVAVAGVCGAVAPGLLPGDVVVASEVVDVEDGRSVRRCPSAPVLAGALRRRGLRVRLGPVGTARRLVTGAARERAAARGVLAVDMESALLAEVAGDRPLVVVRAVVDTARGPDDGRGPGTLRRPELLRPGTLRAGLAALGSLRSAAGALAEWASALGPRQVLLAGPRSFCAGVERAIAVVEEALRRHGPPVYVRRQIVHNAAVVAALEAEGAVFVHELDEVPEGAVAVVSAHGAPPAVFSAAGARALRLYDATCPLVGKVHREARRFAEAGYRIVLVGHEGHDEVEGTVGEAPGAMSVVASASEVERLELPADAKVAYLTQTTLALDEVAEVVGALRRRRPDLVGPAASDVCYATENRQQAVRAVAAEADAVVVVGSANSSNSRRLVEVARRAGARACLVEDATYLDPLFLAGARRVGVTAGASAPEGLVDGVVEALAGLGPVEVAERSVTTESVRFPLPKELR
jgi:4-hydroxy-3-methylbut-2-enyl diphosphate reductase